jgi:hypothetical protein
VNRESLNVEHRRCWRAGQLNGPFDESGR